MISVTTVTPPEEAEADGKTEGKRKKKDLKIAINKGDQ